MKEWIFTGNSHEDGIFGIYGKYHNGKQLDRKMMDHFPGAYIFEDVLISDDCMIGKNAVIHPGVALAGCSIGEYTYVWSSAFNTTVGKFCSIALHCNIGLGMHPSNGHVSTYPGFYSKANPGCLASFVDENLFRESEPITIGNDVWLGASATILDGVTIGDGAIIGAGAVVTRDVEDYAIMGGVPARKIRYRFNEDQISFLKDLRWWDKDIEWIKKNAKYFSDINKLTEAVDG